MAISKSGLADAYGSFRSDVEPLNQPSTGTYRQFRTLSQIEADLNAARIIIKRAETGSGEQQVAQAWFELLEREWSIVLNYS